MKTNNLEQLKLQQQQRAAKSNRGEIIKSQRKTLHMAAKASRYIEKANY